MPETLYVIPAPKLRVLDPATRQPLPPEGAKVERTSYWIRRLGQGDVTEGGAPTAAPADSHATEGQQ